MTHLDRDPIALYILHDILRGGGATTELMVRYGISEFSFKRYLCELRHLGVEFSHLETEGRRIWRCRNRDLIQSSALFRMWLKQGESRLKTKSRAA